MYERLNIRIRFFFRYYCIVTGYIIGWVSVGKAGDDDILLKNGLAKVRFGIS